MSASRCIFSSCLRYPSVSMFHLECETFPLRCVYQQCRLAQCEVQQRQPVSMRLAHIHNKNTLRPQRLLHFVQINFWSDMKAPCLRTDYEIECAVYVIIGCVESLLPHAIVRQKPMRHRGVVERLSVLVDYRQRIFAVEYCDQRLSAVVFAKPCTDTRHPAANIQNTVALLRQRWDHGLIDILDA